MAVGASGVAQLNSNYISQLYADAMFIARDRNIMQPLVRTFNDRTGDESRASLEYSSISASSVNEDEDFSAPTQFTKTQLANLTPGEIIAQVLLYDRRMETDPQNAREDASRELGNAIADKVETDLLSNFSSLTGGTVGSAGTSITWGHFFAARAQLRGAKVPGPYSCVLHEYQWHDLAGTATVAAAQTTASDAFRDQVMSQFYVGQVADVSIYVTPNISIDASDDAYGAMFNRDAMAFDSRRAPRLEPERDASARAWELNITAKYAYGVWRPAFGVAMLFDATAPTS